MGFLRRALGALFIALCLAAPASARTGGPKQLAFAAPAEGTVTSLYGESRGGRFHPGLGIGILGSLTVRAGARGTVTRVGQPAGYEGYGTIVEIAVGGGYLALYAHLSRVGVRAGQDVAADDAIGVAGCTGWCTGTHLHFELRHGGHPIDPLALLLLG